jgi:hypothetical protein
MGKIVVGFEGLCILFTGQIEGNNGQNPAAPSLMVGLVGVNADTADGLPEHVQITQQDFHYPEVTINEIRIAEQENIRERLFRSMVSGDLSLQTYFADSGVEIKTTNGEDPAVEFSARFYNNEVAAVPDPFQSIEIAGDLYSEGPLLQALPNRCRARFHVRSGVLYSRNPKTIDFGVTDINGDPLGDDPKQQKPSSISAGMEITVPPTEYAVLYFSHGEPGFRFEGNRDYEIVLSSLSERSQQDRDHFLYYYSVFSPVPPKLVAPLRIQQHPFNNPFCSVIKG